LAENQRLCDLAIALAGGHQAQHFGLARTQAGWERLTAWITRAPRKAAQAARLGWVEALENGDRLLDQVAGAGCGAASPPRQPKLGLRFQRIRQFDHDPLLPGGYLRRRQVGLRRIPVALASFDLA